MKDTPSGFLTYGRGAFENFHLHGYLLIYGDANNVLALAITTICIS